MAQSKRIFIKISVDDKRASETIDKTKASVDGLAQSTKNYTKASNQNRAQAGLNNAILIETGRVASDASFGIQGVANNISRLVELSQEYARTGSGGLIGAFQQLGKSLLGIGGIIVAFQLLLSFLPKIIKRFEEIKEKTDIIGASFRELGQNVTSIAGNFEIYIRTLQSSSKSAEEKRDAVLALRKEFPDFIKELVDAGATLKDLEDNTELATLAIERQRDAIVDLAMARAAENKIQELAAERIDILEKRNARARELGARDFEELVKNNEEQAKKIQDGLIAVSGTAQDTSDESTEATIQNLLKLGKEEEESINERINSLLRYTDIVVKTEEEGYKDRLENLEDYYVDVNKIFQKVLREDLGKIKFSDLFDIRDPEEDDEFMKSLDDNIPQYIDDVEDYISTQLLEEGKISLLKTAFKLEPKTREAELQQLKDRMMELGEPLIFETEEYRRAVQAINDKYDAIEARSKADHLKTMLGSISSFFKSASEIADGNKDLARASIIASAASASIGIWDSYFAKDPTPQPATLRLAGTIAAQLALAASTVSALQSLNRDSFSASSSGASSTRAAVTATAPQFNVVGASPTNQLAQAVGQQQQQPLKAFVVGSEITNQQQLDRKILNTAGI